MNIKARGLTLKNSSLSSGDSGSTPLGNTEFIANRRYGFLPHTLTGWLLSILTGLLLLWLVTWLLMLKTPLWYRPPDPSSKSTFNQADRAQAALLNLRNHVQDPDLTLISWRITQPEINSMLAVAYSQATQRTAPVHKSQGNFTRFSQPFVRLEHGSITFAAKVHTFIGTSVASLTMSVHTIHSSTVGSPMGRIRVDGLHLGLAPLPPSLITNRLSSLMPGMTSSIKRMVAMYAGAGYARTATPQILNSIRDILQGKPFPLTIAFRYRHVTITSIRILGRHIDSNGVLQPAEIQINITSN